MRLRNVSSNVVVVVRDDHPFASDSDWESVEAEKPKRATKKQAD